MMMMVIYLPSTSGAFLASEDGGNMGRGQSNRFSPNCNETGINSNEMRMRPVEMSVEGE